MTAVHRNHGIIFTVMEKKTVLLETLIHNTIYYDRVVRGGMRCILYITSSSPFHYSSVMADDEARQLHIDIE